MEYKATVHTLEITPLLPVMTSNSQWRKWLYEQNFDYVNSHRMHWGSKGKSEPRLIINPHKTRQLSNGLYHFEYDGLTHHKEIMSNICKELNMNGYTIRRLPRHRSTVWTD